MPIRTFIFSETSPGSQTIVASSQPVAGSDFNIPTPGIAGYGIDDYDSVDVIAQLQGATGGVLDVFLQGSPDEGVSWFDVIHWPQLASGAAAVQYKATISSRFQATSDAPVVVGSGLTPLLAVNIVVNGLGFDRARLVFKSGSGTSAGATQKVWIAAHRTRLRETGA